MLIDGPEPGLAMVCPPLLLLACLTTSADVPEARVIHEPTALERGSSRSWTLAPPPRGGGSIRIEVRCRMEAKNASGSMFFLKVSLNGNEVRPLAIRGGQRLVNRPLVSPVARAVNSPWYGEGGWRVVYAPDFRMAGGQSFYVGDPYTLVLDVTDLIRAQGENRLELGNSASEALAAKLGSRCDLWIESLVVKRSDEPSALVSTVTDEVSRGEPGAGPSKYSWTVHRGGGFTIATGRNRYRFESKFTYPNAGWNHLSPDDEPAPRGQSGWKVEQTDPAKATLVASGPDYRIERTLRFTARKVEVTDSITNRHAEAPLGLMVRHEMSLAGLASPGVRLAGIPDPSLNDYYSPGNPSVHIGAAGEGIGLICEDDVLRNQARLSYADPRDGTPPAVGLRTEMLRLAPGETYAIRWSAYPVASANYYDFINLVREDWRSNDTVPGALLWGYDPDAVLAMPDDELRARFERLGIRIAIVGGGWVDKARDVHRIGFGAGVLDDYWADFRRRIRESAAKIRRSVPGARVLVYYNTQRDTSEAGPDRYRDSWKTDPLGRQLSTDWNGLFNRTFSMVATRENSFGRAMLDVADRYMSELNVDGLYWDEMESTQFGFPEVTYSMADGHTCRIDPKSYTITRELGLTTLLGAEHRMEVINRVQGRGGLVLGNGPTCVRRLLRPGVLRMVEIQHNDRWCHEGNLESPLGYLSSRSGVQDVVRAIRQACLPVAISYDHPLTSRLFPFSPLEIHGGYLLGRERIVVANPGNYGWSGERDLVQLHRLNRDGTLTIEDSPTQVAREARTAVSPEAGEAYVLERLPIELLPTNGRATVSGVRYSRGEIRLRVDCPAGGQLNIGDGTFRVRAGQSYRLTIGGKARRTVAPGSARVSVRIPRAFQGEIEITAAPDLNRGEPTR